MSIAFTLRFVRRNVQLGVPDHMTVFDLYSIEDILTILHRIYKFRESYLVLIISSCNPADTSCSCMHHGRIMYNVPITFQFSRSHSLHLTSVWKKRKTPSYINPRAEYTHDVYRYIYPIIILTGLSRSNNVS